MINHEAYNRLFLHDYQKGMIFHVLLSLVIDMLLYSVEEGNLCGDSYAEYNICKIAYGMLIVRCQ